MVETQKRTLAKTVTFKILAMMVTYLTALFFTSNKETAFYVLVANSITTLLGFYIHERVWARFDDADSHKRTLIKTITYKLWIFTIGTLTKWAVVGDFITALSIGITKNLITAVIYYIHERLWLKSSWGKIDVL